MLSLALLAVQASVPDVSKLTLRELVHRIRRYGDHEWELSAQNERPVPVLAEDELRERLRLGAVLDLADWQTILLEKGYLQHRERWPKSEPFAIGLHLPRICAGLQLRLVPRGHAWRSASAMDRPPSCGLADEAEWGREDYQELGRLDAADREIEFELRVLEPADALGHGASMYTRPEVLLGTISIRVEPLPRFDDLLPRIPDREREASIGRTIAAQLRISAGDDPVHGPWVHLGGAIDGLPHGTAIHLEGALRRDGRAVEMLSFDLEPQSEPHVRLRTLPLEVARGERDARAWTLGLHGTSCGVLRRWDASDYWAGVLEIPLADLIRH